MFRVACRGVLVFCLVCFQGGFAEAGAANEDSLIGGGAFKTGVEQDRRRCIRAGLVVPGALTDSTTSVLVTLPFSERLCFFAK